MLQRPCVMVFVVCLTKPIRISLSWLHQLYELYAYTLSTSWLGLSCRDCVA